LGLAVSKDRAEDLGLTVTKTFRLFQGADAFEVVLTFQGRGKEAAPGVTYRLLGPHRGPVEGEWDTSPFPDRVFGPGGSDPKTLSAYDLVKDGAKPQRFEKYPLKYAGVENQYFVTFAAPWPTPKGEEDRWDSEARGVVLHTDPENPSMADIGVEVVSRP